MSDSAADEVSGQVTPALASFPSSDSHSLVVGLASAAVWLALALLTAFCPDQPDSDWAYTGDLAAIFGAVAIAVAVGVLVETRFTGLQRLRMLSPWLIALALFLAVWEVVTAKYGLLPLPFFPPPQAIIEVVLED